MLISPKCKCTYGITHSACSSKNADKNAERSNNKQPFANGQVRNKNFDPVAMKTLYTNVLKPLVTAGTITQSQSDKVLAEETKNETQNVGMNKPSGEIKRSDTKKPSEADKSSDTNKPNGRRPMNNRLSALVTKKIITLAQSDTINQKIQEAMKNMQSSKAKQN